MNPAPPASRAPLVRRPLRGAILAALALLALGARAQGEFSFDPSEYERKPLSFNGYLEQKLETLRLQGDSPAYRIAYPGEDRRDWLNRSTTTLDLGLRATQGDFNADLRGQASYQFDELGNKSNYGTLMEGGLRWSVSTSLTLDAGKRVQRWGKGYAWSPVGFIERPRDPSDPTASREGFVMTSAEWTRSLSGPISTLGLTALLVPTDTHVNEDFGRTRDLNPALRLSLLAWDTDIDLMWRGDGARPQAWGIDFSRNLGSALEVHGEWARTLNAPRNLISPSGASQGSTATRDSYLAGLRYLTEGGTTWIAEYYHNGNGYSADELDDYYALQSRATASNAPASLAARAQSAAQSGYGRANPGRDYLYAKASTPEPFDWLYGNLALTAMLNTEDGSWQLQPEVSYTGFASIELRSRVIYFGGPDDAEFGNKTSRWRLEASARWFF